MNPTTFLPAAIGGYFELELPVGKGHLYPAAMRLQSARACLLALLQHLRPTAIWMPWFNCPSMMEPARASEVAVKRYHIDAQFLPEAALTLGKGEILLYVNYFGVCDSQVESVLSRFPREQVLLDYSQAFFSAPPECLATFYSPRKFFGVPDGAYVQSRTDMPWPEECETLSIARCAPLLTRIDRSPEEGYADLIRARQSFKGQPPLRMSALTQRLLESIDYEAAKARRQENFALYHARLGKRNTLALHGNEAALCYPLRIQQKEIRKVLQRQRIFVAQYWPDMAVEADARGQAVLEMSEQCLPLPCDQRYGAADIARVIEVLELALQG